MCTTGVLQSKNFCHPEILSTCLLDQDMLSINHACTYVFNRDIVSIYVNIRNRRASIEGGMVYTSICLHKYLSSA